MSEDPVDGKVVLALVVPAHPHPLLCPEQNPGWARLRAAYEEARELLEASEAEIMLIYSTLWPSIIGHQFQAQEEPEWVHVDDDFHHLGSMPYKFLIDAEFAETWKQAAQSRGLEGRTVAYHGFPIDTGSVVALSLLNPDNRIPAAICSSNVYANRSETIVLGKATHDAIRSSGKKAAVIVVTSLSNRMFTEPIQPHEDRIHSLKDDEWNRKLLEFLADGRIEDVSQLSRQIHEQIRVQKVVAFKPMWWLAGVTGQHNNFTGEVHAYEPIHGAGCAVVSLFPAAAGLGDKEFDEDDVESYHGDRDVVASEQVGVVAASAGSQTSIEDADESLSGVESDGRGAGGILSDADRMSTERAPKPVGAYPHARRVGDLLYLSGVGPRQAISNAIPGGPVRDQAGESLPYDMQAQTRACIENVVSILEDSGSSLEEVVDVTSFLVDMDRDFSDYNEVYADFFGSIQPTRTTLEVAALPTPIAIELKVIARYTGVDRSQDDAEVG